MAVLDFKQSVPLTMGVELELQLVDRLDADLTRGAPDLIALLARRPFPGDVKPEITESMIEISTSVHSKFDTLRDELRVIRDVLVAAGDRLDVRIAGGGMHPFQHWGDRQIFDGPRFQHVAGRYGYLAKQFTVFGEHVHIGVARGDDALRLLHRLGRYVPQFIALSACSPFYQGADTMFDCSRLNTIFAFPLSGRAPFITEWAAFERYFEKLRSLGVVQSMKDFYWDIRPKPEYGTIEVRVFDTPLTVDHAAVLAAYVQAICAWLLSDRLTAISEDIYLAYTYNRFQACRFGLEGELIDPLAGRVGPLRQDILDTIKQVRPYARVLKSEEAIDALARIVRSNANHARWQRSVFQKTRSLPELVASCCERWRGERVHRAPYR